MVVAGADAVEHRARELHAERLAGALLDDDAVLHAAAIELQLDDGFVGVQLVADDVADRLAVDGEELVAGADPRLLGW